VREYPSRILTGAKTMFKKLRSARGAAVDWRVALALPLTYYIASVLALMAHEIGHGAVSKLIGGQFTGWYLAPGVVGWSRPYGDVPLPQLTIIWITAGGTLGEGILGGLMLIVALYSRHRWRNWTPVALALGGTCLLTLAGANLAANALLGWGDGYALVHWGVSPVIPVGLGILAVMLFGWVQLPFTVEMLDPYLRVEREVEVWSIIMAAGLPVMIYSLVKSYLLFAQHFSRYTVYLPAFVLVSGIGATLAGQRKRLKHPKSGLPVRRISSVTIAILSLLALAAEIGCTVYFGLDQTLKPPPF